MTLVETMIGGARRRIQPALPGMPSVSPAAAASTIDPVCTVLLPCGLSWGSVRLGPAARLFCWHCTHVAVRMRALMRLHCMLGGASRSVLGGTSASVRPGEAGSRFRATIRVASLHPQAPVAEPGHPAVRHGARQLRLRQRPGAHEMLPPGRGGGRRRRDMAALPRVPLPLAVRPGLAAQGARPAQPQRLLTTAGCAITGFIIAAHSAVVVMPVYACEAVLHALVMLIPDGGILLGWEPSSLLRMMGTGCARAPQGCKHHNPDGCRWCPICILFPCMNFMRRIANHMKLLQGAHRAPVTSSPGRCCSIYQALPGHRS